MCGANVSYFVKGNAGAGEPGTIVTNIDWGFHCYKNRLGGSSAHMAASVQKGVVLESWENVVVVPAAVEFMNAHEDAEGHGVGAAVQ